MRLYLDGEWFDPVPNGALYEHEFEAVVMQHRRDLFPGFFGFRFDPLLVTDLGNVQPNMVLIDTEYRSLVVVEIELATHSLTRHVRPQMEKILAARLGEQQARWLTKREPSLNEARLISLFRDVPHSSTLMVNAPTPHWDDGLKSLQGLGRAVVEVFRSRLNRTILRINGTQPEAPSGALTLVSSGTGFLRSAYRVHLPSALNPSLEFLDVDVGGAVARFHLKALGDDKYLFSRPAFQVPAGTGELTEVSNGTYRIEGIR